MCCFLCVLCSVATQKRSREEVGLAKLREEDLQQQITKLAGELESEKTSLEVHKQRMEAKIQQQQAEIGELKAAKRARTRHTAGSSSGASSGALASASLDGVCLNTAEIDKFLENPPFPDLD